MTKEDILEQAKAIVTGDRQNDYGKVENNFQIIANLWTAYLESKANKRSKITSQDVAVMMILLKTARIASGHHKNDNWIDIAGYAACGGSIPNHNTWVDKDLSEHFFIRTDDSNNKPVSFIFETDKSISIDNEKE